MNQLSIQKQKLNQHYKNLPSFQNEHPQLRFLQIESLFQRISCYKILCINVVASLNLLAIFYCLHESINSRLINFFLGNQKTSHFLQIMNDVVDNALKNLFLLQPPENTQSNLSDPQIPIQFLENTVSELSPKFETLERSEKTVERSGKTLKRCEKTSHNANKRTI